MIAALHRDMKIGVLSNGKYVKALVREVSYDSRPQVVWISQDDVCLDVVYAVDDPRLVEWPVSS